MRKPLVFAAVISLVLSFFVPAIATASTPVLSWGPCAAPPGNLPDAGQQCSMLTVPRDYSQPNGPTIQLAVSRVHAADPAKRRGVLLLNPGGPGGPGLDLPRAMTVIMQDEPSILESYDLIGFDPRGVGQSTPVSCGLSVSEATQALVPLTQNNSFDATVAFMQHVADRCNQVSGSLLPYITTANTARDMDRIRQALREQKVSYFAYSYGTYLGAVYRTLFPGSVDRFVLDSNVDPQWVWRLQFRSWGPGGEIRFPDFENFAATHDATYHLGNTPAAVQRRYNQLLAQLKAHPIQTGNTLLNDAFFRETTFGNMYADSDFPGLASLWQQLSVTPTSVPQVQQSLAALVIPVPSDNGAASGLAVACDDVAWSRDVAQYKAELTTDTLLFPNFGELGSNYWECANWHNQPVEPPVTITSQTAQNVLMVQNIRDLATPYAGALQAALDMGPGAHLLTVNGGGHAVAFLQKNACVDDAVAAWLVRGVMPGLYCEAASPSVSFQPNTGAKQQAVQELRRRMR